MRKRTLSNYEQETIITFNREEKTANIFTYEKTWQQHMEKKLRLKPIIDNGFGGKEYEIDKKRIRPPRAPMKLSAVARANVARRLRQIPVLRSRNPKTLVKLDKGNSGKGKTINQQLRTVK